MTLLAAAVAAVPLASVASLPHLLGRGRYDAPASLAETLVDPTVPEGLCPLREAAGARRRPTLAGIRVPAASRRGRHSGLGRRGAECVQPCGRPCARAGSR